MSRSRRRAGLSVAAWLLASVAAAAERPPLIEAARSENREAVRRLIALGVDVSAVEGDGATALHWASYRDDLETADLLIGAGAKVNAANDLGATPLWTASLNGSPAMVRRLLQAGADPNLGLLAGETPLLVAARAGHPDVVDLLLGKGASVDVAATRGQTALMWAAAQKHPSVVKVLLAHGADADAITAQSIFEYVRRRLAPYKRIRRLEFAPLPKTISGKIRRVELRQAESDRAPGSPRRAGRLRPGTVDYRVVARVGGEIVAQQLRTLLVGAGP